MIKNIAYPPLTRHPEWGHRVRWLAAVLLRAASAALTRLSRRLTTTEAHANRPGTAPTLEFYADAGAPEGALYVNGKLVGYLPGVRRL
jgi:hypothetical protein